MSDQSLGSGLEYIVAWGVLTASVLHLLTDVTVTEECHNKCTLEKIS